MEIKFKKDNPRPVYDYGVKQEWEEHVYYECPAKLTETEQEGDGEDRARHVLGARLS